MASTSAARITGNARASPEATQYTAESSSGGAGTDRAAPRVERRALVVVNPATRGNVEKMLTVLERHKPAGVTLDVRLTRADRSIAELLGEDVGDALVIVAIGGDGTVAAVATALAGVTVPLGIVPVGSTNIIAREQRIPTNTDEAVRLIFGRHEVVGLDVGVCGERRFLHMAGAGLDSRLFAATNPAFKRRAGWLAYVPAAARNMFAPPARFTIQADDSTMVVESAFVMVANGAGVARRSFPIYPHIRSDDGWLDVLVFTATDGLPILLSLGQFLTKGLGRSRYVSHLRARRVRLESDPRIPVQLDGDLATTTPVTFEIAPAALRLIVPPR